MFETDEKLVSENERYKFYINNWTNSLTEYCKKENVHGISLENYYVLKAVSKEDGSSIYLLCCNGQVVTDDANFESMCYTIDLLKLNKY